eukprot:763050-Pleurochrysis_carterae.AAC.1
MTKHSVPKHRATKPNLRIAKLIKYRFSALYVFNRPWCVHAIQVQSLPLVGLESVNDHLKQFCAWLRFRPIAQKA